MTLEELVRRAQAGETLVLTNIGHMREVYNNLSDVVPVSVRVVDREAGMISFQTTHYFTLEERLD